MLFRQLVLQNFGPYFGRQTLNFCSEGEDNPPPITLIGGMNGGGKTTLMDAIRLAFYGSRAQCSTRGNLSYGEFLNQCVNRNARPTEETLVELAFDLVHNHELVTFRLRRRWTRNPKQGKDILEVISDTWLDESLTRTWDERVEYILPIGISSLFLFDGEQVKELADLDEPPSSVVEAIQSLLGLELSQRLATDLDILVGRKRRELASAKELEDLDAIEAKIKALRVQEQEHISALATLQNKYDLAERKHQEAGYKFLTEGGKIASERATLETKQSGLRSSAEEYREVLRGAATGTLPLALISPLLVEARKQGEWEVERQGAIAARDTILERDRRLLAHLNFIHLEDEKVKQIQDFLTAENHKLESAIDPNFEAWLGIDAEGLERLKSLLDRELIGQIKAVTNTCAQLEDVEEKLASLERQLQTAASPETYQVLEKTVKVTRDELFQVRAELEDKQREIAEIGVQFKKAIKDLENYSQENIDRQNNEHLLQTAAKVQQTLQRFRERLTLKKLNKLEVEVTACFRHLLHKSNLVHRIAIESKTFSLSLFDPQGHPVPKHRLSAGEKQLLAIAFLWGLARVSGRNLPIAIDTPLGRLDSSHRTNLIERYFPAASTQVILLSTDTEIGKTEVEQLREKNAIAREYLLKYDSEQRQTRIEPGYFEN